MDLLDACASEFPYLIHQFNPYKNRIELFLRQSDLASNTPVASADCTPATMNNLRYQLTHHVERLQKEIKQIGYIQPTGPVNW